MRTEAEIKELKSYLTTDFYSRRVAQQKLDESYYIDNFPTPLIRSIDYLVRTGRARRMVDKPIEHIISQKPQFFRDNYKKGSADADARVAAEGNRWIKNLVSQNPNPFWEFARNLMLRGEAWYYVVHNDELPVSWQKTQPEAMPVRFFVPDPLVVFADPSITEENGVPGAVIISYERSVASLQQQYPQWFSSLPATRKVPFFMFIDKDMRYIEAENKTVVSDENIYGFVSLVHSYSGFGRETYEGDPATLAFGRLTPYHSLLQNECHIESDIAYVIDNFSYNTMDIITHDGAVLNPEMVANYNARGPRINQLDIPTGSTIDRKTGLPPAQEIFLHRAQIKKELDFEDPPIPAGSTGRHEDIIYSGWRKRFEPVADRCAQAFATALGIGLRICETIPDWMPPNLKKKDIAGRYDCRIELKAEDPIENDRRSLLGRSLYGTDPSNRQIDLQTNHIKYQGMTQEESDNVIARMLVDGVTIQSPIMAQILGMRFVKELGLEEYAAALAQQGKMQQDIQKAGIGSQGGEPRTLNIKTPQGAEMADLALMQRGERRSPIE